MWTEKSETLFALRSCDFHGLNLGVWNKFGVKSERFGVNFSSGFEEIRPDDCRFTSDPIRTTLIYDFILAALVDFGFNTKDILVSFIEESWVCMY